MILRNRGAKTPLLSVDLTPARVALNLRERGAVFPCKWCSVAEIYTNGPIVFENMETTTPGIFACGNVVHVHDLVDYVSAESEYAGAFRSRICSDAGKRRTVRRQSETAGNPDRTWSHVHGPAAGTAAASQGPAGNLFPHKPRIRKMPDRRICTVR